MSLTRRTKRAVDDALGRLREEYGAFDCVEKTWTVDREEYDAVRERFRAGTVGGAGAWIRDGDGRALMVRHEGEESWSDPGGKGEPGESLEETARREVREESGVRCSLTGVLQAHVVKIVCRGDKSGANRDSLYRLIVIFDAAYESGIVRPREGEIAEARWMTEMPENVLYDEVAEFPL